MRDIPASDDPFIGQVLQQRYEIRACVGVGGMGKIYRAHDRVAGTDVAIKILRDDLSTDEEVIQRFEREVGASRVIRHRNVVDILGSGLHDDGRLFLIMELLNGEAASDYLERKAPLTTEEVCSLGYALATGLHACHVAGVIHRDLKPDNIMVTEGGEDAKIFDFGLVLEARNLEAGSERLTAMDIRIGTPMYMSPEYIDSGQATPSCDLYALGVILYEAATGHPLFTGPSYEVLHQQVHAQPTPIEDRAPGRHPRWIRELIEGLLDKDPTQRPQTGAELAARLRAGLPQAGISKDAKHPGDDARPSTAPSGTRTRAAVGIVLSFALLWHVLFLVSNLGSKSAPVGGDLITTHYAVRTAVAGTNPYERATLQAMAAEDGIRRQVPAFFQPPSHLLLLSWTALPEMTLAHTASIVLNEWTLAGVICILALWWRPLGAAVPVVLAATVAVLTAIPIHHQAGQHQLFLLALVLLSLWADQVGRSWSSGALLGLACAISLRPALFALLWLAQGRRRNLLAAGGVFASLQVAALALGGLEPAWSFWTGVLPNMLQGVFEGGMVRADLATNHAIASVAGIWGSWAAAALLLGGAAFAFRAPSDDTLTLGARGAALCLLCVILPVFGRELHLVWTLPATALAVLALYRGRLSARWAPAIGIAIATLSYPMKSVAALHTSILVPGLPLLAPLALEIKLLSILVLFGALVLVGRQPPRAATPSPAP